MLKDTTPKVYLMITSDFQHASQTSPITSSDKKIPHFTVTLTSPTKATPTFNRSKIHPRQQLSGQRHPGHRSWPQRPGRKPDLGSKFGVGVKVELWLSPAEYRRRDEGIARGKAIRGNIDCIAGDIISMMWKGEIRACQLLDEFDVRFVVLHEFFRCQAEVAIKKD